MNLAKHSAFEPLPPTKTDPNAVLTTGDGDDNLGPLRALLGKWEGTGFNNIWRPLHDPKHPDQTHFLQLNATREVITFEEIKGKIPNRGLLQPDIDMFGIHYMQQVFDVNTSPDPALQDMLHFEPGIWLNVPSTTDPAVAPTVCRMASIPHGTTVLAQGPIHDKNDLTFDPSDIIPFPIGGDPKKNPSIKEKSIFEPQTKLDIENEFRTGGNLLANITQSMIDDPNSVLADAVAGQTITKLLTFPISSGATDDVPEGGGTANTAFLAGRGKPDQNANANAAQLDAKFWIETIKGTNGQPDFLQLQYTQTVLLNFNKLSWPHMSVATLRKTT